MFSKRDEMHVFFVFTPLHSLIVASIIELEGFKNILIVSFSESGGGTLRYCNRLFSEAAKIKNINLYRDFRSALSFLSIISLKYKLRGRKVCFYTGSIKSIYSRLFIGSSGGGIGINTFDDGCGNLALDGYLSQDDSLKKKILLAGLGVVSGYYDTLKKVVVHYSIYEQPNIYDCYCKVKKNIPLKVPLTVGEEFDFSTKGEKLRVLLTQPFSELNILKIEDEVMLYEAVLDSIPIDFYLRHPAESKKKIMVEKADLLETGLIAEEVILSMAKYVSVEVYAFGSTALLNLMNIDNVECIWMTAEGVNTPAPFNDSIKSICIQGLRS